MDWLRAFLSNGGAVIATAHDTTVLNAMCTDIFDVDLQASRVSRVAVIGANGAGKSTAIKVLLGELKATGGEVYRHPELRLAYVAQHAFQHLEKHLTQTP